MPTETIEHGFMRALSDPEPIVDETSSDDATEDDSTYDRQGVPSHASSSQSDYLSSDDLDSMFS